MRCLNQDVIENLFCIIRQHGIHNTNPICVQFIAALKTAVLSELTLRLNNSNCEENDAIIFDNFKELLTNPQKIIRRFH